MNSYLIYKYIITYEISIIYNSYFILNPLTKLLNDLIYNICEN